MKRFVITSLYFALFIIPNKLSAQKRTIQTAIAPAWITINTVNYTDTKWDNDAEDGYVDLAYERQVSLAEQSVYCRKAIRILTDAGVQNSSEINVTYDPSFESILFHDIRIIRGANAYNQLVPAKFKIIQQEEELDKYLYNGSLSAVLFLEDVRKGDVIEYSYTRKGFNPIFKGKYADNYQGNFGVPLGLLYYKLIVPPGRAVTFKKSERMVNPVIKQNADGKIYEWKLRDVPAFRLEDKVPSWFDPFNNIAISEYGSWKEVNDWALALFPQVSTLSVALQNKVEEIRKEYRKPEEQLTAALRFVQDEIRYMGMEMGEGSHRPNHPNKVIAQRFGDCKDKTYLLLTLLKAMNIECYPVLINTSYKKEVLNWLPTATAFDHVTVQIKLNGTIYWFDPTISYQRGPISQLAYPDYQCGLVISPQTTSLTTIALQNKSKVSVEERFIVKDQYSPVQLLVTTKYEGSAADYMRSDFNATSQLEMKKTFEDFYKSYYEDLKIDSLRYADDEKAGVFTTHEWYTVSNFWENEKGLLSVSFNPYLINTVISKPSDKKRKMPFAIRYPTHYTEDIIIEMPDNWDAKESYNKVKNNNFLLEKHITNRGKILRLHYEFQNLKDHVTPEELSAFLADMKKLDEKMGYEVTWSANDIVGDNSFDSLDTVSDVYAGLYVTLGLCVFITIMVRRNKRQNSGW